MNRNNVEIRGEKVIKTFSSHMMYARESNVYAKLRGTGLAPEVISDYDGCIEHRFADGKPLSTLIDDAIGDPRALAPLFERFMQWYLAYRDATKLVLGRLCPEKFIVSGDRMVYLDFEHCRPGFPESDIAALAAWIARREGEGGPLAGINAAQLFVCVAESWTEIRPETLAKSLREEYDDEFFVTWLTCAGIVKAESSAEHFDEAAALLSSMPQRFISAPAGLALRCRGFEPLSDEAYLREVRQPWALVLSAEEEVPSADTLRRLLSSDKTGKDEISFGAYPKLLRIRH